MTDLISDFLHAEELLPELIAERDAWEGLFVDYHEPFVERLWRTYEDKRLYLHLIHPCERKKALFHPHKWGSVVRVHGSYGMDMGYGEGLTPPPVSSTFHLGSGSLYAMLDPNMWHSVFPDDFSFSFMMSGPTWDRPAPKSTKMLSTLSSARRNTVFEYAERFYKK